MPKVKRIIPAITYNFTTDNNDIEECKRWKFYNILDNKLVECD